MTRWPFTDIQSVSFHSDPVALDPLEVSGLVTMVTARRGEVVVRMESSKGMWVHVKEECQDFNMHLLAHTHTVPLPLNYTNTLLSKEYHRPQRRDEQLNKGWRSSSQTTGRGFLHTHTPRDTHSSHPSHVSIVSVTIATEVMPVKWILLLRIKLLLWFFFLLCFFPLPASYHELACYPRAHTHTHTLKTNHTQLSSGHILLLSVPGTWSENNTKSIQVEAILVTLLVNQ